MLPVSSKATLENIPEESFSSIKTSDVYTSDSDKSLNDQQVLDGMALSKRTIDCEAVSGLEKKAYDSNIVIWSDPKYKAMYEA